MGVCTVQQHQTPQLNWGLLVAVASTTNARGYCYKECNIQNFKKWKENRKNKKQNHSRRMRKYAYFQIIPVKVRHTPTTRRVYRVKYSTHRGTSCYLIRRLQFPFCFKSFQNMWTYTISFFWVGLYIQWIFLFLDSTTFLEIAPNLNNNVLK